MSKATWADVTVGATVELGGREWTVAKLKRDGKTAKVTVEHKGRTAKSVVKLRAPVTIVTPPLHDTTGAQTRWATEGERSRLLEPGDPSQTKRPAKPTGDVWDRPADRVEKALHNLLEARLVAETKDESMGYYVPPVDVTTVAAHMALFHGGIPSACSDEGAILVAHDAQHEQAKRGEAKMPVSHWHSERRP